MSNSKMLIAANMRGELARRDKSNEEFADAIGIDDDSIGSFLDGNMPFTTDHLDRAAKLFGLNLYQLMMLLLQPIDSIKQVTA